MTATMSERDKELSLVQHLGELRTRLMVAAFAVLITSVIAFLFSTSIIRVLLIPVDCQWFEVTTRSLFPPDISARLGLTCSALPTKLVALSPTENFTTFMRVSLFAGIAIAMPVILLFVLGMAFCYFVLLPNAIKFLISFGGDVIQNQLRASDYISFVTTFILGVGLVFEMPAIIYALVRVHVVRRSWLAKQRRYVFLLVFVIGAIITPTPDPFNQTLVAIPMYLLFELGLFLARFAGGETRAAT